ncbi:hypothetical protein FRC14_007721 [Serendipita sp. 396]|nr:hypothetical protein FRC14_007721 [Serendipita sp. 396]KAG8788074.1 hypothetical protein FRC15_006393 [Serendipita sp. 397]
MNNVRRLFGAATTGTSTTAIETSYASYEPTSSTTWTPQLSASSGFPSPNPAMGTQRPTRTPSPPPPPKLSMNPSITNINRLPNRQNSVPLSPDDERSASRRTNSVHSVNSQSVRTGASKKHRPGHSKALSSFSRKLANGTASPPLPNLPAVTKPKDELIIELLASEAVVDSRNYEILGTEQLEELKRELNILSGRVAAATKKVTLETKLRDAALSLDKVQSAHRRADSKGANGLSPSPALEAANVKVHNAQMELSKQVERYNEVQRQLLEHRSAVLSYSLNRLESMLKPQGESHDGSSGRTTPANQAGNMSTYGGDLSPTSAVTNMSLSHRQKFEGAHFFAGHANSKSPYSQKSTKSSAQVAAMEEQLASAEKALKESKEEEEALRQEAENLRRENQLATEDLSKKMQEADDTISDLRTELQRMSSSSKKLRVLEDEKRKWEDEKAQLEQALEEKEAEAEMRDELDRKETEIRRLRDVLDQERQDHEEDRQVWEEHKREEIERLREELEEEHAKNSVPEHKQNADVELDMASERLQALIKTHGITLSASQRRDMSLMSLITATSMHLDSINDDVRMRELEKDEWELAKRRMESELKASLERRERLSQELEDTRREAETARREVRSLEERLKNNERPVPSKSNSIGSDPGSSNGSRNSEEIDRVMTTLRSLWSLLPSREARAAAKSTARSPSPTSPLRSMASRLGEPPSPSLADLDVRALKALYDPRNNGQSPLFSQLSSPVDFSIDAFSQRVQALVTDDRAIIERLLRFAQSHELLKNNAARAQKLAQESSMGLETYQKQVKSLEERNTTLITKQNDLLDEINNLQANVERTQKEKRQLDIQLTEQKVALRSMSDANTVLSARTLALAEEVSTAPESMRIKLEAQLNEVRSQLKESMEEVEALRSSEQGQKAALLEELNHVQGENSKLRDQLRVELRKQGK